MIAGWGISCEIALTWMSLDLTDDQSTLVQVMAWCHQATSHYMIQCWPRYLLPYGVSRPQWINSLSLERCGYDFRYVNFKHNSRIASYLEYSSKPCPVECQRTSTLFVSEYWFKYWLGAIRQQAILIINQFTDYAQVSWNDNDTKSI